MAGLPFFMRGWSAGIASAITAAFRLFTAKCIGPDADDAVKGFVEMGQASKVAGLGNLIHRQTGRKQELPCLADRVLRSIP